MKKYMLFLLALPLFMGGCARNSRDMWEDTKSCGRYMGKGVRTFLGQHTDNREYAKNWDNEAEFIPLADSDQYGSMQLSKESPGDPGSPIPGIEGFHTPDGKLAVLFQNIHFDTDNYTIHGEENIKILETIVDYLKSNPHTYVFVEGHADERGTAAYNLALGSRRANSIRSYLLDNGVNPDQLFTISYGKERPLVQGPGEEFWWQNRRGQFKLFER